MTQIKGTDVNRKHEEANKYRLEYIVPSGVTFLCELCHGKTGREIFVVVIPKEDLFDTSDVQFWQSLIPIPIPG